MKYPQTVRLTELLKERNQRVRKNNQRIHSWVLQYLDSCLERNEPVTLVTQWCFSKGLERRSCLSVPTSKEIALFLEMTEIYRLFEHLGFRVNWYITFHRGYVTSRRLNSFKEAEYRAMIGRVACSYLDEGWLLLLDWEDDILGHNQPLPNPEVLTNPERFVSPRALEQEFLWAVRWLEDETNLCLAEGQIRQDIIYQIACEAEEGRFLTSTASPFGRDFLLVPLEISEQYDFFCIFAPEFKKRIISVLPPYPWRIKAVE